MSFTHRIRLRRPWEHQLLDTRVCWLRRFGRPRTLSDYEEVWLVLEGFSGPLRASLNGQELEPTAATTAGIEAGAIEFPVTGRLSPRNELRIELPAASGRGDSDDAPPGNVYLEIRRPVR